MLIFHGFCPRPPPAFWAAPGPLPNFGTTPPPTLFLTWSGPGFHICLHPHQRRIKSLSNFSFLSSFPSTVLPVLRQIRLDLNHPGQFKPTTASCKSSAIIPSPTSEFNDCFVSFTFSNVMDGVLIFAKAVKEISLTLLRFPTAYTMFKL